METGAGKVKEKLMWGLKGWRKIGEDDEFTSPNQTGKHQQYRRGDDVATSEEASQSVLIVGVVPRLNFDTFFSSFATVFITWTLTDWSSIMQLLLTQMRVTAILYFLGIILVGNFLLENFLASAVIVEFRDRAHVRRIIEIRDSNQRVKEKLLALSGMTQPRRVILSKDQFRSQNLKEFAERQKMLREQEEIRNAEDTGRSRKEVMSRKEGKEDEDKEDHKSFFERVYIRVQSNCRSAEKKINARATDTTCLVVAPDRHIRRLANYIVYSPTFEKGICIVIVFSSALLAYRAERNSSTYRTIVTLDTTMNMVFLLECALKVLARGWSQYFLTTLGKFDALIVAAAAAEEATKIALVMSIWTNLTPSKERDQNRDDPVLSMVFSALRALRVVRLFNWVREVLENRARDRGARSLRSLGLALEAYAAAFKPVSTALVLGFCVLLVFALLGMQLFSGGMQRCSDLSKALRSTCQGTSPAGEVRIWRSAELNFDWIGNAMLAVFTVATGDGWNEILFNGVDSSGREGPKQNSNLYVFIFFAALQMAGFVFVTRLILAVWVDTYESVAAITPNVVSVAPTRRGLPMWEFESGPVYRRRKALFVIVMSRGFDALMTWVVLINIALMAFSSYKEAVWQGDLTVISEAFFSAVFVVEALLKMTAAYPSSYFKSPWNQFDCSLLMLNFIITALTPLLIVLGGDSGTEFLPTIRVLKFFRILKILRVVRAIKLLRSLKAVVAIMSRTVSAVGILLGIMIFLLFNGAVIGSKFFGHMCNEDYLDDEPSPHKALRCMLLKEENLVSRHGGFASITDGMVVPNSGKVDT